MDISSAFNEQIPLMNGCASGIHEYTAPKQVLVSSRLCQQMVTSQNHLGDKTCEAMKMQLILGETDFSFTLTKSITEWNCMLLDGAAITDLEVSYKGVFDFCKYFLRKKDVSCTGVHNALVVVELRGEMERMGG